VILGLPSAGLHTNGYTLARQVLLERPGRTPGERRADLGGRSVEDVLLAPHLSYLRALQPLLAEDLVHAMAHITGGGFYDNIPRVLPAGVDAVIRSGSWPVPPVFEVIASEGGVSFEEMHRVFNMGIGMVVLIAPRDLPRVAQTWQDAGQRWYAVGNVVRGSRRAVVETPPGPASP
jgi:phosphoribosylformylglycinamidine cyclo-ligase